MRPGLTMSLRVPMGLGTDDNSLEIEVLKATAARY